jgi:biopolymer transport protein TolR
MRTVARQRRHKQMNEINVVPYIDVMLVLLVIFMVTAPLLTEGVKVDLPQAKAKPITSDENIPFVVHVNKDGAYYVNQDVDNTVTLQQIQLKATAVKRANPDTTFLVRGDANVDFNSVIQAMVALQIAGVDDVGLVTKNPVGK